jgi:DNA-binding NarL/FixJ family response regulator
MKFPATLLPFQALHLLGRHSRNEAPDLKRKEGMELELPVQLLPTGVLRAALETVLAAQPDIRIVEFGARVVITQSTEACRRPPGQATVEPGGDDLSSVVLLTKLRDPGLIEAVLIGVQVFVDLDDPPRDLLEGVRRAARREAFCSTSLHGPILNALRSRLGRDFVSRTGDLDVRLTDREREVAELAAHLQSRDEIARELCISVATVKTHLANARRKMGVQKYGRLRHVNGWVRKD